MRSVLDIFGAGRAVNLAGAPAYTRRSVAGTFNAFSSLLRNDREVHLQALGASGTLFAIVDRLAFTVSTAEWQLWRKAKSGRDEDRELIAEHAALDVWNKPNAFFTRQELIETVDQHFELTGEGWIVVVSDNRVKFPTELWPVRPDRMKPLPSASKFLNGYIYIDPDGDDVPLTTDQVMLMRRPSPLDPYRGMGPVGTVLLDVEAGRLAREWNRNFFANSAEPGGIIESEERLSDDEWSEFRTRWAESHKGVGNAHRVAVLEGMKWVDRKYTRKDMEFVEGLNLTREAIREAFGFPKPLLGAVDDVNRANADAADTVFARWLIKPRLERLKGLLNNDFLPLFGATTTGLEFDYVNPVPEDIELANATRDSLYNAARTLVVDMKATRESVVESLELPATLVFEAMPEPVPPTLPAATAPKALASSDDVLRMLIDGPRLPHAIEAVNVVDPDLSQLQADWERELDSLLARWRDVTMAQRAQLRRQVRDAVESGDALALAELAADHSHGAELLAAAMAAMFAIGAASAATEATAQGANVEQAQPDDDSLGQMAVVAAALLATGLAATAGAEALRRYSADADPDEVASAVDEQLAGLSESTLRARLGGMLTGAQNAGRLATFETGPDPKYYATETLDKNTCAPCRAIDGTRLPTFDAAMLAYGGSGYLHCEGTWRCRGTMIAVYE